MGAMRWVVMTPTVTLLVVDSEVQASLPAPPEYVATWTRPTPEAR